MTAWKISIVSLLVSTFTAGLLVVHWLGFFDDEFPKYVRPFNNPGEFIVPREDLPPRLVDLIGFLQKLPSISSDSEFRAELLRNGLQKEPDHYKAEAHLWYVDQEGNPLFDQEAGALSDRQEFVITIYHRRNESGSSIFFYGASLRQVHKDGPRQTLWETSWPYVYVK